MDRGGDNGAFGDDAHPDDPTGTADPTGTTDPTDPAAGHASSDTRQWTHPSEIGLAARVDTDRRRGRALVVGLVAIGVGVLLGTAAMATVFSDSSRTRTNASAPVPLEGCLAMVDISGSQGARQLTGLLVDNGAHVLVVGEGLDAAERIAVRIGGSSTTGSVVAHDPYVDMALIELASPSGSRPEMTGPPRIGDSLRIVHFDPAGHRRSAQVRVDDVAMTWSRPDHTVADDVMALTGDTRASGVLADPTGAVAGLVIGTADGRTVAYDSDALASLVGDLHTGGVVQHPWIGVRAGDAPRAEVDSTTQVSDPPPGGSERGALVIEVLPGSPAEAGGVIPGDLVTAVAGEPVRNMGDLVAAVAPLAPGDVIDLRAMRDGEPMEMTVEVAAFPG